jgi:hypothetical protein
LSRSGIQSVGIVVLWALVAVMVSAQNAKNLPIIPPRPEPGILNSVRLVHDKGIPALEIVATRPLIPSIQFVDSPPRLVIDLSNTRVGQQRRRVPVQQENILTIRSEQYQIEPPVTRIVMDLLVPYGYTWDVAGNRLMVRLRATEDAKAASKKPLSQSPLVQSAAPAVAPVFVPITGGVGDVVLAGKHFAAGSSLTAGSETTVLQLARGGEVRVCPGTTVSVTPSKRARALMLGMSTGALETHYALDAGTDTVLTPDFRILFPGPGEFDYAISADSHGNTCVRALKGNTSPAIVSELMSDRNYQVKPTEQAVFHSGQVDKVDTDVPLECGCPPPVPVLRADASTLVPDSELPKNVTLAQGDASSETTGKPGNRTPGNDAPKSEVRQALSNGPETQSLPPSQPDDVHIQVDAPLVFRARKLSDAPAAPTDEAVSLPVMQSSTRPVRLEPQVQPPPAPIAAGQPRAQHHGLLRRIFTAIFH